MQSARIALSEGGSANRMLRPSDKTDLSRRLQRAQARQGIFTAVPWNEQMVVIHGSDDIHADAKVGQPRCHDSHQANRFQARMNVEANPRPFPVRIGLNLCQPLLLTNERKLARAQYRVVSCGECVALRVEPWSQALQKSRKIALPGQGFTSAASRARPATASRSTCRPRCGACRS